MKTRLAIIVPIYNGAKYLPPFMESVLAQDYSEFDMICVDDASDDGTFEILQEYAEKDGRIHIYQNDTRKGAAFSRNFGLKRTNTDYVIFLDADDLIERDFLSQLLCAVKDTNADAAFCEQDCFEGDVYDQGRKTLKTGMIPKVYSRKFRLAELDINDAINIPGNPIIYLIRKALIEKYRLEFQSLSCFNDTYFVEMIKILAEGIIHVREDRVLMHRRVHNQISRISYNRDPMNAYRAALAVKQKLEELNLWERMRKYYICRTQRIFMTAIRDTKTEANKEQFLQFLQREGLDRLGFREELLQCGYLTNDKKYICGLFLHGSWQDIEAIEPFETAVRANTRRIKELFAGWSGKRIVFWGIGYRWGRLYQWCSDDMYFKYLLADMYKAGQLWDGMEIVSCEEAIKKAEAVVVLNDLLLDDIRKQMRCACNKSVPVFSMEKFIMTDGPAERCWS